MQTYENVFLVLLVVFHLLISQNFLILLREIQIILCPENRADVSQTLWKQHLMDQLQRVEQQIHAKMVEKVSDSLLDPAGADIFTGNNIFSQ